VALVACCCRFADELLQTAHSEKINALAFPHEYSEVFATAGVGCIRVWHLTTCRELLRIAVPNLECHCVTFSTVSDGVAMLTPSQTQSQLCTLLLAPAVHLSIAAR
jgi:WD40 repeat protein